MDEKFKKSFSEVYEILKIMPDSILNKIPTKLQNIIENERDKNYKVVIKEPLEIENFQYETIVFLGMLYRDFLCSEDEKKKLKEKDIELEKRYNQELSEIYNIDDLFNRRKKENFTENENKNLPIKAEEKKWFQKLFNLVKGIFR